MELSKVGWSCVGYTAMLYIVANSARKLGKTSPAIAQFTNPIEKGTYMSVMGLGITFACGLGYVMLKGLLSK